jgi:STE24 endopeptidase
MGHYAHADILKVALVLSAALSLGLVALAFGTAPLMRLSGATPTVRSGDAEALPAVAVIVIVTLYGAGLAAGAYLRWANVGADAYSLDVAREPDGLAAALEHGWDHDAVDPNPLERAVFYTHPPLKDRIVQAMRWKASHTPAA